MNEHEKGKLKLQMEDRMQFLKIYSKFDSWLHKHMFVQHQMGDVTEYLYDEYEKHINSMYAVETYLNHILQLRLTFVRDRNEHKFMLIFNFGVHSEVCTLDEFKQIILCQIDTSKKEITRKLNLMP